MHRLCKSSGWKQIQTLAARKRRRFQGTDDELARRHYTTGVSTRAKRAVLGGVIAAILYVLISPLPELDATHLLNFPAPALMLLVVLLLTVPDPPPLPSWLRQAGFVAQGDTLLAQTCVRLC
jgi:hypothetical protein